MLAASGFTGCQKDVNTVNKGTDGELKLTIKSSPAETADTRTILEGDRETGFNTAWNLETDKLGVYSYNPDVTSEELTMNSQFDITNINGDGVATFVGNIRHDAVDRTYDLYAYYPRNAANNYSNSTYTSVAGVISDIQTMPANGTFDHASDYMVALPGQQVIVTGGETLTALLDNFQFRYLVGFMHLSVPQITADGIASTDVVENVKISAEAMDSNPVLSGDFTLDLTNGEMSFTTTYNEVTVVCPEGVTLGNLNAWAVVNPFSLTDEIEELTFLITTATHTIEKTVTVGDLTGGNTFSIAAGGIKTFHMTVDNNCTIQPRSPGGVLPGDILYEETWGTYGFSGSQYGAAGALSGYDYSGTTIYSGDPTTTIAYSTTNTTGNFINDGTGAGAKVSGSNFFMQGNPTSSMTIKGIELHGATTVILKYASSNANIRTFYSVGTDEPTTSSTAIQSANSNSSGVSALNSFQFTVPAGTEVINILMNKTNTTNCRLDNIILEVVE